MSNYLRKEFADYIWDKLIMPQAGYSFSKLHTVSYSMIAVQEAYLAKTYPIQYWNSSVLSVMSGATKEEGSTDYSKMAKAVSLLQSKGVLIDLPDINKSGLGFTPDKVENKVLFGLSGISGINSKAANIIIEKRPFADLNDFLERVFDPGLIEKKAMLALIKSGAFSCFDTRRNIMRDYIIHVYTPKEKLTMQNLKRLRTLGLVDNEPQMKYLCALKDFVSYLKDKKETIVKTIVKPKDTHHALPESIKDWYLKAFIKEEREVIEEEIVDEVPIISIKRLEKLVNNKTKVLKEWINTPKAIQNFNRAEMSLMWKTMAEGEYSDWEMSTLCYYHSPHPLLAANLEQYGIVNFNFLPIEPEKEVVTKGKKTFETLKLSRIAGTVIDKNNTKHTVTLLTKDGVVTCKYYSGAFEVYNKELKKYDKSGKGKVVDKSWFKRGNMVILCGFRRGDQFTVRSKKGQQGFEHSTMKIESINTNKTLSLTMERKRVY